MKVKTARRFVARNWWKATKGISESKPSFWKRWKKCLRITMLGEDLLKRKY